MHKTTIRFRPRHLLLVFPLFTFAMSIGSAVADELHVGIASADITPPVPYRMSGYFSERTSTGIKDRLHAKAIVFRQGKNRAALVFCDLIGIPLDVSRQARQRAARATGIPAENIAIAATHSHTGPLYFGALRQHFHDRMVKAIGRDELEKIDYPAQLVKRLVEVITKADSNAKPTQIHAGNTIEKRLSFNRRFHMKGGGVRFNPGQQNPNIIRAAGPIDPQVGILSLTYPGKQDPYAALVSFALHLDTVGGTEYSADYPHALEKTLQSRYGKDFMTLFGTGTCGDINHIDVKIKGRRSAAEIGSMLGDSVKSAMKQLPPVTQPELAVLSTRVRAPLQRYSQEEIRQAEKNMERVDSSKLPFLDRVNAYKVKAVSMRPGDSIDLEVQAFRISRDVAIVTLPGEVFVDLGIAIKAASPFDTTLVIELTNDAPGYIPTRKAFAEGSYETVNSRIQPGYGEKMASAAIGLLNRLGTEPDDGGRK